MSGIQFTGLVSGIDTGSILDALAARATIPIERLQSRIDAQSARKTALGDIRTRLSNLLKFTGTLADPKALNGREIVATTSAINNRIVAQPTVDSSAAIGQFKVTVEKLASSTTVQSPTPIGQPITQGVALATAGFRIPVTEGTFSINGAQITIDANTVLSDGVDDGASNSILGKINNAGTGVTASVINDAYANPNLLQLTSGSAIALGSGTDSSNFLSAAHLLASPGTTTRTSTQGMGQTNPATGLTDARLSTALSQATGSFTINGTSISYDADNESLNSIISKINTSQAGVTATYDQQTDTIKLTSNQTGSQSISLADVGGNFLAATGLIGRTVALGENAEYTINGATYYSSTNTVSNAVPGVTLKLTEAVPGDEATVTISANDNAVVKSVKDFVEQYNSTMTLISDLTKTNPDGASGLLSTDSTIRQAAQSLRSVMVRMADNLSTQFKAAADVGLSFGAVGSAVGATGLLTLDESKLRSQLLADRNAVVQLFSGLAVSPTLNQDTGPVASVTGTPTNKAAGTYTIYDDGVGNLTVMFKPSDGSGATTTNHTVQTNTAYTDIIPGMTITTNGAFQVGNDTIVVARTTKGLAVKAQEVLNSLLRDNGTLDAKDEAIESTITDMSERISQLQSRIDAEQIRLAGKFAAMEQAFAQFETQRTMLDNYSTQLSQLRPRR